MSSLTKRLDEMSPQALWVECEELHRWIREARPNGRLDQKFRAALRPDIDFPDDQTPDPSAMRMCIFAFMSSPSQERRAILRGWCYEPGWMSKEEYIEREIALVDYTVMPAIRMGLTNGSVCVEAGDFPCSCLLNDTVDVQVRFGTPATEVVAKLEAMIAVVKERWGNLPGINPKADSFTFIPVNNIGRNKKGGVPQTHHTGKVEPQNGEKARKTAAA